MKKEILRLEHLYYGQADRYLLEDLSLNIFNHEIFGVLGLVDAGKTLLADYLMGKRRINSGRMYYNETEVKNCEDLSNKNLKITHITNDTTLISDFTIADNFYIAISQYSKVTYSKSKARVFANSCLNDLSINISPDTKAGDLNKCHQHIVAMCIAFYCHSKLIIVDDAMAGYSPQDIIDFQMFLNNLRKRDLAIMIMTHSIEYATLLSDRVAILKNGRNIKVIDKLNFDNEIITEILLNAPVEAEEAHIPQKSAGKVNLFVSSVEDNKFNFEVPAKSVVGIFDPGNSICNFIDIIRRESLKESIGVYSNKGFRSFDTIFEALKERVVIIFENYFNVTLFENVDLKDNIEVFAFDKLARGPFGYISKKRENVFLRDSKYYAKNKNAEKIRGKKKNAVERQKILLERMKMANPEMVISVKPFSHLDPELINMTFSCFKEMADSGTTIFVLSNDYSAFYKQFDKVFVVRNGEIEAVLEKEELKNTERIASYLVSFSSGIV